jgi:predicted acyl esterase
MTKPHRNTLAAIFVALAVGQPCEMVAAEQRVQVAMRDGITVETLFKSLAEDVEVIGPVSLKLYPVTDVRDTDFTAVLIDVTPVVSQLVVRIHLAE